MLQRAQGMLPCRSRFSSTPARGSCPGRSPKGLSDLHVDVPVRPVVMKRMLPLAAISPLTMRAQSLSGSSRRTSRASGACKAVMSCLRRHAFCLDVAARAWSITSGACRCFGFRSRWRRSFESKRRRDRYARLIGRRDMEFEDDAHPLPRPAMAMEPYPAIAPPNSKT